MKKINFKNLPDTSTPLSAENLNLLQNNIEESTVEVSSTQPTNKQNVWLRTTTNLYNYKNVIKNIGVDGATGELKPNSNFYFCGYIKVSPNQKYTRSDVGTNGNIFWDENKKYISRIDGKTFTAPSNARYVSFNVTKAKYDNNEYKKYMVNKGSSLLPYEDYKEKEILTYNGSGYDEFADVRDTGWQDIQFKPGYSNAYDWAPCQVRRVGKMVQLRGYVKGFSEIGYTVFATLTSQFLPSNALQFLENSLNIANQRAVLNISTGSELSYTTADFQANRETALNINATYFVD